MRVNSTPAAVRSAVALAVLAAPLLASATSAAATSAGSGSGLIGSSSTGSVRISATIAPTFHVHWRGPSAAIGSATSAEQPSSVQLCLESNMGTGQFSISAEAGNTGGGPALRANMDSSACIVIAKPGAFRGPGTANGNTDPGSGDLAGGPGVVHSPSLRETRALSRPITIVIAAE